MKRILIDIDNAIRSRYPLIYIVSSEERRVQEDLRQLAEKRGKEFLVWTCTSGIVDTATNRVLEEASSDPLAALDAVVRYGKDAPSRALFLFKDLHPFITGKPQIVRKIRDTVNAIVGSYKSLIFLSPTLSLPPELEKDTTVFDYPKPGFEELDGLLQSVMDTVSKQGVRVDLPSADREKLVKAALGLTMTEAENVLSKAIITHEALDARDIDLIIEEKQAIIRKSGVLDYYPARDKMEDLGGLENLKSWLQRIVLSSTEEARKRHIPNPRGVLLAGVQGCGKSLAAKTIAASWQWPMIRFDVGRVFAGLVGESERNMRSAIQTAESIAPCVLWIDELEKSFAGVQGGGGDSGTASRVFSSFLTWLQEKTAPVFFVATANNVMALPPELTRKGRVDEIFFVDLPTRRERTEIFQIHLRKREIDPELFDVGELAGLANNFSGAEIEQVVIQGIRTAFVDGDRGLSQTDLRNAVAETTPLATTFKEHIEGLREWARTRQVVRASRDEEQVNVLTAAEYGKRQLELTRDGNG